MSYKWLNRLILVGVVICFLIGILIVVSAGKEGKPRLFLLKAEHLDLTKKLWKQGDRRIVSNMKKLISKAEAALKLGPYTVTDKKDLPPSGDKHDFLAYLAYSWPNPNTKDGLPWVFRDGYLNPDYAGDWKRFIPMTLDVELLALAYYFTGNETYARHAALLLRIWFIDKTTRMNPHADYSKITPGKNDGGYSVAGFANRFRHTYDAAGILERSPLWTDTDRQAFQQWTREFMQWVETSHYGETERKRHNNHGTFYDLSMALQAMYVGDEKKARETIHSYIKNRFHRQFKPDGTQFYEMKRANNYYYHRANLMAAFDIAQLADHFDDIDLWNYKTAEGAGLGKAVEFLIPFLTGLKKWPYFAGDEFKASGFARWSLLRRAALGFKDYSFEMYADEIPGDNELFLINLTYPRAAIPGGPGPDFGKNTRPRLFLLNADHLALTKELWEKGNRLITLSMKGLLRSAKKALRQGPYAVTDKEFPPPSGDKHDFFAYLAYSWPNPKTKDGLPWIFRDGHSNPKAKMDWNRFLPMAKAVHVLALAYYFTGSEAYARHAALLLRTWFINKATRMNPNANYGKMNPGVTQGGYPVAGFGYVFRQVYDAAGILEGSFYWTDQDRQQLQQWTHEFMHWVETSHYGETERKRHNNHGTFYDMNMAIQAMYVGDEKKARQVIKSYIENRIPKQFKPDGTQPYAMKSANNYDYHRVNLMIAFDIAQLADHFHDIDVWNYETPEGAGLRKSAKFLIPYFTGQKKWPYFCKEQFQITGYDRWCFLQRAALGFGDRAFDKAVLKIKEFHQPSITHLTHPRLALYHNPKEAFKQ
ncbi:MAG: alginate lyase family protein [Candidatus Aminicenantes bacterium]|nr:MAG: alginate lyase family protein [Candidatus Aminicenantes bacterium]